MAWLITILRLIRRYPVGLPTTALLAIQLADTWPNAGWLQFPARYPRQLLGWESPVKRCPEADRLLGNEEAVAQCLEAAGYVWLGDILISGALIIVLVYCLFGPLFQFSMDHGGRRLLKMFGKLIVDLRKERYQDGKAKVRAEGVAEGIAEVLDRLPPEQR